MRSFSNLLFIILSGCVYENPSNEGTSSAPTFGVPGGGANNASTNDADGDGVTNLGPDGQAGTPDDDCNDGRADIHPGATESVDCDGIDADCDGSDRSDLYRSTNDCGAEDDDGDGIFDEDANGQRLDCDDDDPEVFPGAGYNEDEEDRTRCCQDNDGDGYCDDNVTSGQEDDGVWEGSDCNDGDALVNPDASDTDENGIDDDCDGDVDSEGGSGVGSDCDDDDCDGWCEELDCDDDDPDTHPQAGWAEDPNDDAFLECCRDSDGDGWCDDSVSNSEEDDGMVEGEDCDDDDDNVYPDDDGDCVDNGSGGGNPIPNGMVEMRITNDGSYATGATPSWETWIWNNTDNLGYWPGRTVPVYCGTGTSGIVTCNFSGGSGDMVELNGAWDQGRRWLFENYAGNVQNHYAEVRFAGSVYSISMVENASPAAGACTRNPGTYNLICRLR